MITPSTSFSLHISTLFILTLCLPLSYSIPSTKLSTLKHSFHQSPSFSSSSNTYQPFCDITTQGPICLYDGDRIILPPNVPHNLIAHYTFDETLPTDQSTNNNHAIGTIKAGPSFGGHGSSALFTEGNYLTVPHSNSFDTLTSFTFTFWIFIIEDSTINDNAIRYCPVFQKGNDDLYGNVYERSPVMYYDLQDRNLKIVITTTTTSLNQEGESIISKSKIFPQRWMHISLIKTTNNEVSLYINGILDTKKTLKGDITLNKSPLYIGNVPWYKKECVFPFLLDELRIYSYAVKEDYIQAEASPVLGGISPSFLRIGCINCLLTEASKKCVNGYRLCTSIELHTGGYQIARGLGLLSWDTHIWTYSALDNADDYASLKGLGLCCAIIQ